MNRERLLSSRPRRLEPGDVIQLGGVQLRVERNTAVSAAPPVVSGKAQEAKRAASHRWLRTHADHLPSRGNDARHTSGPAADSLFDGRRRFLSNLG